MSDHKNATVAAVAVGPNPKTAFQLFFFLQSCPIPPSSSSNQSFDANFEKNE
jgi:hypothetical protein